MTKHEQKSSTGPRWPAKTIHRSLVDHLPQEEQEGWAEGLGRFKPLIRLSGLHEGLVRALRADRSELSRVLDGQLRAARERLSPAMISSGVRFACEGWEEGVLFST